MGRQPLEDSKTGVHRAKLWEIAFYALNNTSTNAYMILVSSISYFLEQYQTGLVFPPSQHQHHLLHSLYINNHPQ